MKAIVIDDENPALVHMQRLIERDGRLEVAGTFTQAQDAIDQWQLCMADVVFLDIEMPGLCGLEAGERLAQLDPDVHIVYVTAYGHYALEVFKQNVQNYLLKPVDPERFSDTVTNLLSCKHK
ncbi:response regulator [Paenibacillus glucanolyticus]|jgi:two-component SAPR family response regulator|uniref:LytR/AlgR family response regulator transcription factor n=1 Tax=Paenibacillus TaxID=44249 RepID=UPI0003E1E456|nr:MULTISPECIES: response regulator [Paenibacillus]ANA80351.1 response regulator receiver protein [Paenibacillus glucanolyticus]AVV55580.1 response regulator [Paenibacillus glucanolyticus]ETT30554.1 chemotaxis protein CheY [Paenibacillus sp. FSL R5-808]MPY15912.1 response regulator [Paenibacillus glucanolyticus]